MPVSRWMGDLGRRAIVESVVAYCRADSAVKRVQAGMASLIRGALSEVSGDDLTTLTARVYQLKRDRDSDRLFPWEEAWYRARLPDPPAVVFVAGAGTGRESLWLIERGYTVVAAEPGGAAVNRFRERLGEGVEIYRASHQDLSRVVLDGVPGALSPAGARQYDAAILGWGSLGHVLEPAERQRALQAVAALTPAGPVLASFLVLSGTVDESRWAGRAWKLGATLGRWVSNRTERPGPFWFGSQYGVIGWLTHEEVASTAQRLGREVVWENSHGEYPHVTFLAPGSTS